MAIRRTGSQTLVNRGVTAAAATPVNIITGSGGGGATVNISSIQIANSTFVAKDDLAIDTSGGFMILNGTGFQSGAVVYIQGTAATSTAFVSSSRLNVTVPALSSGLLDVYVVNTDGSGSIYLRSLNANGTPSWTTTSPLTTQDSGTAFAINLVASGAAGDGTITYAVSSGSSLPSGTFLASNGYFYGTVSGLEAETTYSFSVDAIDAQNQETARSFNITVRSGDLNLKNTVLLLNGEISSNTWINDASANSFAITVNGDTKPTRFNPYQSNWSNYFDGNGDYIDPTNNVALYIGNSDGTIEFWINPSGSGFVWNINDSDGSGSYWLSEGVYYDALNKYLYMNTNITNGSATNYTLTSTVNSVPLNTWTHFAFTKVGTTWNIYINGVLNATGTKSHLTTTVDGSTARIGARGFLGYPDYFTGNISNFRLVKGNAVYTSAFTPSTTPLISIANTSLLTCQTGSFVDKSNNSFTITKAGNVITSAYGPFIETDIITGSAYFDGTGDYLSLTDTSSFGYGTGDFTIEFWMYPSSTALQTVVSNLTSVPSTNPHLYINGGIRYYTAGGDRIVGSNLNANEWYHIALCRNSGSTRLFVNGNQTGSTYADGNNYGTSAPLGIGTYWNSGSLVTSNIFSGYISNLRILKGTALYTSTFTPPTSPLTVVANTSLLTLQSSTGENNNRIVDLSSLGTPISRNGNVTQGTFSPYQRGGWSNYFDGSGDFLTAPSNAAFQFGTGNFTVEFWLNTRDTAFNIVGLNTSGSGNWMAVVLSSTFYWQDAYATTNLFSTNAAGILDGSWHHVAVTRLSGTTRVYFDGVSQTSASDSANYNGGGSLQIGSGANGDLDGYISNLRIIKGTALYSGASNFTPPALPLTSIANTSLLTCADNAFIDDSPNNFSITRNGDVSVQPFSPFKTHTYTANTHSVYFDGTGDYLQIPTNNAFAFGDGDFTCESWVYISSAPASAAALWGDLKWASGYNSGWYTHINNNLTVTARVSGSVGAWVEIVSSNTLTLNGWNHVAVSKQSGTFRLFINGVLSGTNSGSYSYNNVEPFKVGIVNIDGLILPLSGYISNLRVVKGVAVYTGNFALPNVAPLQLSGTLSANSYSSTTNVNTSFAAANTSFLTCSSNTIVDLSTVNAGNNSFTITVNGDARALPFNPLGFNVTNIQGPSADYSITNEGGSMYFDGTGDFLKLDTTNILTWSGTTTFTVEGWFYQTAFDATSGFMNNVIGDLTPNSSFGDALYWSIGMNNSNQPGIRWYGGPTTCNASEALTLYRWNHVAWVVSSGVLSIYINGKKATLSGTSTITAAASSMNYVVVGADRGKYYSGYMSGLRVLKGVALYTSSFVPPVAPPTPIVGSTLLLNGTNGGIIDYTRKNNLETVGDVKIRNNIVKYGNTSMYFDGTGDYMNVAATENFVFAGDFTVEFWMYPTAVASGERGIVGIGTVASSRLVVRLQGGSPEKMSFWLNGPANNLICSTNINTNQWYHVALVRNGSGSNNLKLYLNGVLDGQSTSTYSVPKDNMYIGRTYSNYDAEYFSGYIDDLRITKGVARYTSNFSVPNKHPTN